MLKRTSSNVTSVPPIISDKSMFSQYLRRVMRPRLLDWEIALSTMVDLCWNPSIVFKNARNRKFTKNQWARDDPAFVVLLGVFMLVVALAYSLSYHALSIGSYLYLMSWFFFIDFLLAGTVISSITWYISNKYLRTTSETVEWLYSFDIHCNAFFPLFMSLYVGQYILLPILTPSNYFSLLLSNTLYCGAFCYYFYITFRGYVELQNLSNTECFLYPIAFIVIGYLLSIALGWHCTRFMIVLYFG